MEEIEHLMPNGLHDAYLLGISTDYKQRTLRLELNWLVGSSAEETHGQRFHYQPGSLLIHGLRYCVVEAPLHGDGAEPDQINGFETGRDEIERCNLPDVNEDVFRHSLYVGYWTSFIHFAGTSAEVIPAGLIVREMGR